MLRPCIVCGAPTKNTRCPPHQLEATRHREQRRPSRQARGYDKHHDQARRHLAAMLPLPCGYGCGTILTKDARWVAAHRVDGDPTAGWIAACPLCNERAKQR